jgi:hypothetical protein
VKQIKNTQLSKNKLKLTADFSAGSMKTRQWRARKARWCIPAIPALERLRQEDTLNTF